MDTNFSQQVKERIQSVCQEAKIFIEKDIPFEIEMHYSTNTSAEIAEKYREVINYYNKLQHHIKNTDYLIYLLTDLQNEIDKNRLQSEKKTFALSKQIEILKILHETLKGIDRGMYHTLKYYEKISS